jgi:hypothetical protein
MALTTFVTYVTASGAIKASQNRESGDPPAAGVGESVLDAGLQRKMPGPRTHRVDLAGPAVVAKAQGERDTEEANENRELLRIQIATLEAARAEYLKQAPPWDTDNIDARIAQARAVHDALS